MTHPLLAVALSAPKTHRVTTTYACGKVRTHNTRSMATAENFAHGERVKIGRKVIDRETRAEVQVVSAQISDLALAARMISDLGAMADAMLTMEPSE